MAYPKYSEVKERTLVAPSVLAADAARLGEEIKLVSKACDLIHLDIMDGHFVPNISFGPSVLKAIRPYTELPIDVHLMISRPELYISDFVKAGADLITVHVETCPHLHRVIQQIKEAGVKVGVTLNPGSSLSSIEEVLDMVDLVLIMSVNPGFGGQKYIASATNRIQRLRKILDERDLDVHIQVDGGVSSANAAMLVRAGANNLVAGSAVFGASSPIDEILAIQKAR